MAQEPSSAPGSDAQRFKLDMYVFTVSEAKITKAMNTHARAVSDDWTVHWYTSSL